MSLVLAALLTFALTTVFTMAGVGAAFVLIPVFLTFGIELQTAMATALLLNAVAMAVASATFIRKGLVAWRLVLPMLVLAVLASPLGVHLAQGMDRRLLLGLFVAFLLFAALMILLYRPRTRAARVSTREALTLGLPIGALAGFVGGLLGVGGGNIIVPALVASGMEPKRASASAACVVLFASLAGFLAHVSVARIDSALLVTTGLASAAGAGLGAWLASEKLAGEQLKRVIALVLIAVAIKTAWSLV
ncbi:MAG: sulfite exporter TauE/SafE family protein [Thiobacillaceae bacterium]